MTIMQCNFHGFQLEEIPLKSSIRVTWNLKEKKSPLPLTQIPNNVVGSRGRLTAGVTGTCWLATKMNEKTFSVFVADISLVLATSDSPRTFYFQITLSISRISTVGLMKMRKTDRGLLNTVRLLCTL